MDHDPITITYQDRPGGRRVPAITIGQVAQIKGWTTKRAQTVVARLKPPVEPFPTPIDGRTPIYPRGALLAAIEHRPGKGRTTAG